MSEPTFELRATDDADLAAIVALERAIGTEIGIESTESKADVLERWSQPRFDRARHERIAVAEGSPAGLASLWFEADLAVGVGYVLPAFRGQGMGSALTTFLVEAARAEPDVNELHMWSDLRIAGAGELLASFPGSEHARTFIRMISRAPGEIGPPEWPEGVRLVALEDDELLDAVIEAHDNSFIDHWGFKPADRDELTHSLTHPDEDPALWFVAFAGEQIAGFNLCHLRRGDTVVRGHLGPIGTTRPFRRIGLARALLRHGVREMVARGATEVMLGVDSQNPHQALGLYERNGFEVWGRGDVYRIKL